MYCEKLCNKGHCAKCCRSLISTDKINKIFSELVKVMEDCILSVSINGVEGTLKI